MPRQAFSAVASLGALGVATAILRTAVPHAPTIVAMGYLLVLLFIAAAVELWMAVAASIAAVLCFNFFFLPPVGTLTIADPQNWAALVAFSIVSVVASELSASARARAREALSLAEERAHFLEQRREAELAQQRAELSAALLASLSHDLRTPLTAIRTAVSNLDSTLLSEDQRREQARLAVLELERLTRLFDEILDMARIDAGSVQPRRSWTTPAEIVEAAISHAGVVLAGRDVRVDATEDHDVEMDPRLASAALAQILENAARYAPEGAIEVRGWTDDQGLRLEVRDSGPGFDRSELDRLFEPFYRGKLFRGREPGTGMGLAITRGLLAADAGRVWAENLAPHGACFSIVVPARVRQIAAMEA